VHTAIRAASLTLANYLADGFAADPELGPLFAGTMEVSLNTPEEMVEATVQGLSVWLYRVMRDDQRLNAPPERTSSSQLQPTPLPLRMHYLITPIVRIDNAHPRESPQREQTILGKAMQLLYVHPILQGADLRDTLTGSTAQIAARLEPLGTEELTRVWSALRRSYQLSVSYETAVTYLSTPQPDRIWPVRVAQPQYSVIVGEERL
jgi:hypothetical protein